MRKAMVFLLFAVCVFLIGGTWATGEQVDTEAVIRVAGDWYYPPYEFTDDNGQFRGFNNDCMTAISLEEGMQIQFIPMEWDEALEALKNGEVDAVQGMSVTQQRKRYYDFTEPLIINEQAIFVHMDTQYISTLPDLRNRTISYQRGDVTGELLSEMPQLKLIGVSQQLDGMRLLVDREVDAFIGNKLTGLFNIQRNDWTNEVKVVGVGLAKQNYAIAVKKGNADLLNRFDRGLRTIKQNGTYDKIYEKWFGQIMLNPTEQRNHYMTIIGVMIMVGGIAGLIIAVINRSLKRQVDMRTEELEERYILERRMLTELAQMDKMGALEQLSAGVAHELRNPLTSIQAYVNRLPKKREDNDFMERFQQVVPTELERLSGLLNELVGYAKPDRELQKECVQTDDLVEEVVRLFKVQLAGEGVCIQYDSDHAYVYADRNRVKQMLINVLLNALEASENGDTIFIRAMCASDEEVCLEVADQGAGIPAQVAEQVFEPFFTTKDTGTGLGLPVCKQIAEEHGGRIEIDRREKGGTVVRMHLPVSKKCQR